MPRLRMITACCGPCMFLALAVIVLTGSGPDALPSDQIEPVAAPAPAGDVRDCRIVDRGGLGDFTTIQAAIDDPLTVDGTCVMVNPGTYVENINFRGKNITLQSTDPQDPQVVAATIIDGNQAGPVVTFGWHETRQAVIAGFTIRNGYGYGSYDYSTGGGINCSGDAQPTILNCVVENNVSAFYGGGILFAGYSAYSSYSTFINPLVSNCTIRGNTANNYGGGIAIPSTWETENLSARLDIIDVEITQNSASWYGGGVYVEQDWYYGSPRAVNLDRCEVAENEAQYGGGISAYMAYASYCTFRANSAGYVGGGIHANFGYINDSTVTGNTASSYGGGAAVDRGEVWACNIQLNSAGAGGGLVVGETFVHDNTIQGNEASAGGGLYAGYWYSPYGEIRGNLILDNVADSGGGIAYADGPIIGNTFRNNRGNDTGGALLDCGGDILNNLIELNIAWEGAGLYGCDGQIRDNIIADNQAGLAGGGLRACDGDIRQNTIVDNWAGFGGGGLAGCFGPINGNIVWGNDALVVGPQIYFSLTPNYCDVENYTGGGVGNLHLDPLLTLDRHLTAESPCRDAGDPAFAPLDGETDIDGEPRVINGRVDVGADEFGEPPCIHGDFTGDGLVTMADVSPFVLSVLGETVLRDDCLHGDMNADGLVNGADVQLFTAALLGS